jgi:acetyl-CoA carboxylase carboxyl transferase subunit alpha
LKLKVIDGIIPEPKGGAHNDLIKMAENIKKELAAFINDYSAKTEQQIIAERFAKFRSMGQFQK